MKNRLTAIISIAVCMLMVVSVFTACSFNKGSEDESTTLTPDDTWYPGTEDTYEPVDVSDVELVAIVSEALGDEATGFNGDLSTLTSDQLAKVKEVAEKEGYVVDTDDDGNTSIKKESNVKVSEVSDEKASEIFSEADVKESTSLTPSQYEKVSKAAEDNGAKAVTNQDGDVTIIETTVVPTTAAAATTGSAATTASGGTNGTTTIYYPSSAKSSTTSPTYTSNRSGGTAHPVTAESITTSAPKIDSISIAANNTQISGVRSTFKSNTAVSDGTIAVGNATNSKEVTCALIVKYNTEGKKVWSDVLSGDDYTAYSDVCVLSDGSIIAVGETLAENLVSDSQYRCKGSVEGVIAKYSSGGEKLWVKVVGGSGSDMFYTVDACSDGGYIVGGETTSKDYDFKGTGSYNNYAVVCKFTSDNTMSWFTTMGGSKSSTVEGLVVSPSGPVYAVIDCVCDDGDYANIEALHNSRKYTVLWKLSDEGKTVWTKAYSDIGNVDLDNICLSNDNGCVIAGSYSAGKSVNSGSFASIHNGGSAGTYDGMIIKVSASGNNSWMCPLVGFQSDYVTGIVPMSSGYLVSGYTTSTNRDFSVSNLGDYDSFVYILTEGGKADDILSFGGSEADRAQSLAINGNNVYVCGATLSSDGSFASGDSTSNGTDTAAFITKLTTVMK